MTPLSKEGRHGLASFEKQRGGRGERSADGGKKSCARIPQSKTGALSSRHVKKGPEGSRMEKEHKSRKGRREKKGVSSSIGGCLCVPAKSEGRGGKDPGEKRRIPKCKRRAKQHRKKFNLSGEIEKTREGGLLKRKFADGDFISFYSKKH